MKPSSFREMAESPGQGGDPRSDDPTGQAKDKIAAAGLRLTKARLALCSLLFAGGTRHVTAETLFEEAKQASMSVSLATVYKTLREFSEAGLLRPLRLDGIKSYYDNNVYNHQHFYLEDGCHLIDTPAKVRIRKLPAPPEGYTIDRVDVVIRLRRKLTPATSERANSIGAEHGERIHCGKEGSGIEEYVVETHADHTLASFKTQHDAIEWAKKNGYRTHVARATALL